jgi:hypothetical protein
MVSYKAECEKLKEELETLKHVNEGLLCTLKLYGLYIEEKELGQELIDWALAYTDTKIIPVTSTQVPQ